MPSMKDITKQAAILTAASDTKKNKNKQPKKSPQDEQQNHRQYAVISKVNILPNRFVIRGT